ncbi:PKD domain-containing protein [Flaviaesturariibacter amylovorans]|uniref:PKD domain-containing protein n=1 Tax=Flaviaesturariibacter amylovorans TaxID=1084520 RepID=A0ABP8GFS2_9BACT
MRKIFALFLGVMLSAYGNAQSSEATYDSNTSNGRQPGSGAAGFAGAGRVFNTDSIAFTGPATAGFCPGGNLRLQAKYSTPGSLYQWLLNGNPIGGATDSLYTATAPGDYSIVVTAPGGTVYNWPTLTVVEFPVPAAPSFTFTPNNQCSMQDITFTNTTGDPSLTYAWDFGDPNSGALNTSTASNPVHHFVGGAFGGTQTFDVGLKATNSFGCSTTATQTVTTLSPSTKLGGTGLVVYNGNPVFTSCNATGATLTFVNESTSSNSDYTIIWGDNTPNFTGTTFPTPNITHPYSPGNYTLQFIVTGTNGCRDTGYYSVYIGSNPAVGLTNPGNTVTCSESSLTFPITSTSGNSPGTIYTITFNDGSPAQVFPHPAPASVTHTFNLSSCGTTSSSGANTYPNSFSAAIKATNPCGSSSANVVPIYISKKPRANFTVNPGNRVCVNSPVNLTNSSGNMSSVNNGTCTPGKVVWTISPATGWTNTGNLGNNNNSADPAFWTGGSNSLNVTFTVAGTYTVRMQAGNTALCQTDEIIQTICVSELPVASFTLSDLQGCGPLLVTSTNTSPASVCGADSYAWTVSYDNFANCQPNASSWTFAGGTSATSANPQISFTNPGIYTVQLVTTRPGNVCSNSTSQTVTVKSKPNVTFDPINPICQGDFSPVATANDCYSSTPSTFQWSFAGGTPATAVGPAPTVNYASTGTFNIQLDVINECGTTTVTQPVTVNPTPEVTQPGNYVLCNGAPFPGVAFASPLPGITYTWTNDDPGIGLGASGSGNIPPFTASNSTSVPRVATITVTPSSSTCSGPARTFTITVNPTPPINGGPDQIICNAPTATMQAVLAPGTTGVWTQVSGPASTITSPSSPTTTITGLNAGTYQYRWTVTGSGICPTVEDIVTILNRPLPTASAAGPDSVICDYTAGSALAFTLNANSVAHNWELGTWTVVSNTTGVAVTLANPNDPHTLLSDAGLAAGVPQGAITLRWTIVNDAGCTPSADDVVFTIAQQPSAGTVGPLAELCYENSVTLTATGYTGTILKWRRKDAPLATNPFVDVANNTPSLNLNNLTGSVEVQFIVGSPNGTCPQRDTVTAIVPVAAPIVNTINGRVDSVCTGVSYNTGIVLASGGNGSAPSYQWQLSDDGIVFNDLVTHTLSHYTFTPVQTVWLRRVVTIGTCTSISDTIKVWVEPPVANNSIGADQTICINTAPAPITGSVPTPANINLSFQWQQSTNGGSTWTDIAGATTQDYAPGVLSQTTMYRRVVSSERCPSPTGGVSNEVTISITPRPAPAFAPSTVLGCSPLTVTFTNNTTGLGNTYVWDFGDGSAPLATANNNPVTHTYTVGVQTTFTITLTATNGCGVESTQLNVIVVPNSIDLNVTVNATQLAGCAPHSIKVYNASQGGTMFVYDFNDGSPVVSNPNNIDSVAHTFLAPGAYNISIRATNNCSDTTAYRVINVYATPTPAFTPSTLQACVGQDFTFTNGSTGATNYQWDFGDNQLSSATNPTHSYAAPGTYTVKLRAFNTNGVNVTCVDSVWMDVTVLPSLVGSMTVSGTGSTCAPFTATFTNNTTPATSVTWDFGDGSAPSTLNSVSHTFTRSGTFTVTLTVIAPGGCRYVTTQDITVGGPAGQLLYTPGYVCAGQSVRLEVIATGATTYTWDFGNGVTQTNSNTVVNYTYPDPGTFLPSVTLNGGGCSVLIKNIPDSVRVDRTIGAFTAVQTRNCGNTVLTLTDTSTVFFGKALVEWDLGNGVFTAGPATVTQNFTVSGNYTVRLRVTSNSGCITVSTQDVAIVVNNTPVITLVPPAGSTACARVPASFSAVVNSVDAIANIQWNTSNGITGSGATFNPIFGTPGVFNVVLTVNTVNGCTATTNLDVTVNPTPTVNLVNDQERICRGASVGLFATGAPAGGTYRWDPNPGLSCYDCPNPVASPLTTTIFKVSLTNGFGCASTDSVLVQVVQPLAIEVDPPSDSLCRGDSVRLIAGGAESYTWSPAAGLSCTDCPNPWAKPNVTTIYTVTGIGEFGCFTDSKQVTIGVGDVPTVNLGPDLLLATGTVRPLTASVTGGPIASWSWTPATNLSCANCPQPAMTAKDAITYIVQVTTGFGCTATDTLNVKTFCASTQAFVPNAFSPDGDGINDVLMVRGTGILQVKSFRIFNRWGEVVFERANFAPNNPSFGWDGKVKGTVTPPDVYVYTAEVICENGMTFTYKGNVSVLK